MVSPAEVETAKIKGKEVGQLESGDEMRSGILLT